MRRSTVVILPLRLAVPGLTNLWMIVRKRHFLLFMAINLIENCRRNLNHRLFSMKFDPNCKFQKLCIMLQRHNICPNDDSSNDITKSCIMFLSSWHIHILLGLWRTLASWSNRPKREHEPSHRSPTEFYYSDYGPSSYKAHATSIRQNYISFTWLSIRVTWRP